jgi:hypothetical protein
VLVLIHSGQTGVERGVQRAADAAGLTAAGFCTADGRDELGRLPTTMQHLTPCYDRGPRAAIAANLEIASAAVICVPNASKLRTFTGMDPLVRAIRARGLPYMLIDSTADLDALCAWVGGLPKTSGSVRLLVTGPRGTRWPDGEKLGWRLAATLAQQVAPAELAS